MLRFVALTILAYFIFRWLDRLVGPRTAPKGRSTKNSSANAPKKSSVNKNVGEYIDYEEVKDSDTSDTPS